MTWTPVLAIEKRLEIREIRSQRKKEFDAAEAIDKNKEDLLESYLLTTMNERGEEQIKTEAGTAYKSPQMRVTMTDRSAVILFVVKHLLENVDSEMLTLYPDDALKYASAAFDLFTNHVNKEAVKELITAGEPPPGISIDQF